MQKFVPLNFELMANPVNWLIVPLTLLLGGFALALVTQNLSTSTASES